MAFTRELVQHLSGYVVVNCIKTICGAGLVGFGMVRCHRRLRHEPPDQDDDNVDDDDKDKNKVWDDRHRSLERDVVVNSMIIGLGLFLSIPSVGSQWFLEAVAPIITASDVVSDVATNNLFKYVRSWKPSSELWDEVRQSVGVTDKSSTSKSLPNDQGGKSRGTKQ